MLIKPTAIVVIAIAMTTNVAIAGTMGPICTQGEVTVPCETAAWSLGVQALYLQPITGSPRVFVASADGSTAFSDKWNWGYELDGAYRFGTGNDLSLSWIHFDEKNNVGTLVGATQFGPAAYTLNHTNRFDQVNMVLAQRVNFGLLKKARFFGGLQYININSNHLRSYQVPVAALEHQVNGITEHNDADFNGVGPVIGVDYAYEVTPNLSMTATTAGSIVAGSGRNNTGFAYAPTGLVPSHRYQSTRNVVPGVEAKLGLNYAQSCAQGVLNLFGGYQVLNYFNILPVTQNASTLASSDFGLYGPYLGLNWVGSI